MLSALFAFCRRTFVLTLPLMTRIALSQPERNSLKRPSFRTRVRRARGIGVASMRVTYEDLEKRRGIYRRANTGTWQKGTLGLWRLLGVLRRIFLHQSRTRRPDWHGRSVPTVRRHL